MQSYRDGPTIIGPSLYFMGCVPEENSQFNAVSVRKSYIGFAVAYALHNGYILSIDDPVLNYIKRQAILRIKRRSMMKGKIFG